eukprot:COSAG02_NODE_3411_length_6786_cov_70.963511_2_plen_64_part_00
MLKMAAGTSVRTAVAALVVSAVCVAARSGTERGNETRTTWEVQSIYALSHKHAPTVQLWAGAE